MSFLDRLWPPKAHASPATNNAQLERWLEEGRRLHLAGDYERAKSFYRRALQGDPNHFDAVSRLGELLIQQEQYDEAEALISTALKTYPESASLNKALANVLALTNRHERAASFYDVAARLSSDSLESLFGYAQSLKKAGKLTETRRDQSHAVLTEPSTPAGHIRLAVIFIVEGDLDSALDVLRRVSQHAPSSPLVSYLLGLCHQNAGRIDSAIQDYEHAIALRPDDQEALINLGDCYTALKQYEHAFIYTSRALKHNPDDQRLLINCGRILQHLGRSIEARHHFEHLVDINPESSEGYYGLGLCAQDAGDLSEAFDYFNMALHYRADLAEGYFGRATVFRLRGEIDRAIYDFNTALRLRPQFAEAHCGLGVCLQQKHDLDGARAAYESALAVNPQLHTALTNLCLVYREFGEYEKAKNVIEAAIDLDPNVPDAWCNYGLVLADFGDLDKAIDCYDEVLKHAPADFNARWNKVLAWLLMGDFEEGWKHYDLRWESEDCVDIPFSFDDWDGSPLNGRQLLVFGEQGLGDEIMFSSCIPDLIRDGASLTLWCEKRLEPIFKRSFPEVNVCGRESWGDTSYLQSAGKIDCQIAIGSLPNFFRRRRVDFPTHTGFLKAEPSKVAHWQRLLKKYSGKFNVGISWKGGTSRTRRQLRSIDLYELLPLFEFDDVNFFSLQYGEVADDISVFEKRSGKSIHHLESALSNYDDTAAFVGALDLVISVQTAIVHLSGALGKSTWAMIPFSPEWRYLRHGETMPWYPSVKLFRQQEPKNWSNVVAAIRERLVDFCISHNK